MRRLIWLMAIPAAGWLTTLAPAPVFAQENPEDPAFSPFWQPPASITQSVAPPEGVLALPPPAPVPAPIAPPEVLPPPAVDPLFSEDSSPPINLSLPEEQSVPEPAPEVLPAPPAPEPLNVPLVPPPVTDPPPPPPGNHPPTVAAPGTVAVDEGAALSFAVPAADEDAGQTVSVQYSALPAGAAFDGTSFSWTPNYTQAGTYTVNFLALDNGNPALYSTQAASVTIIVNNVTRTITASAGANGSISPAGEKTVDYASNQTFTITPAGGYYVGDVVVDGSSKGAVGTYTFDNVTSNHTISATFVNSYTITATAGPNGSISPAGAVVVSVGGNQTFGITPNPGYSIVEVLVDNNPVGPVGTYQFTGVTANHTIKASFLDKTPPVVTASLTRVVGGRHDDEDDEDGDLYRVSVKATDAADSNPVVTAYITQPLASTTLPVVSYKREKKNRIQIKQEKRRILVELEGPDKNTIEKLWREAFARGGFLVSDRQVVRLDPKRDNHPEAKFYFDKTGRVLISAKTSGLKLVAYAEDHAIPVNRSDKVEVVPRNRAAKLAGEAGEEEVEVVAQRFSLQPNYPNPFNPTTTLRYHLDDLQEVRLAVYDVTGQRIKVLVNDYQGPGYYEVQWDATDASGQQVAPGLYLYRLDSGSETAVGKMLLLK